MFAGVHEKAAVPLRQMSKSHLEISRIFLNSETSLLTARKELICFLESHSSLFRMSPRSAPRSQTPVPRARDKTYINNLDARTPAEQNLLQSTHICTRSTARTRALSFQTQGENPTFQKEKHGTQRSHKAMGYFSATVVRNDTIVPATQSTTRVAGLGSKGLCIPTGQYTDNAFPC